MLEKIYNWFVGLAFSQYMKNRPFIGNKHHQLPNGEQVEYIEFYGDPRDLFAQYIWKRIIISEWVFKNYSENAQDVVIAHELGHKKTPAYMSIPLIIVLLLSAIVGLIFAPLVFLYLVFSLLSHQITINIFVFLVFGIFLWEVILLLIFMPASWALEGYAEFYAINVVGIDAYKRYLIEWKQKRNIIKKSRVELIRILVSYPPRSLILWVHSKLSKSK